MPRHTDDPRLKGLHIKLSVDEDAAIRAAAMEDRLGVSVWARRVLLRAVDARRGRAERGEASVSVNDRVILPTR